MKSVHSSCSVSSCSSLSTKTMDYRASRLKVIS